ncbi:hypothetical protein BX600DRAFT_420350 [Xylariales sp. PMI_506]|nr:hypothetical protein BX600DRAFT_420350 [Xylariales sp. PMI_506]
MASQPGSHGIARTSRVRTEEQRQQDLEKIKKYRDLEDEIRAQAKQQNYNSPDLFSLTTKLLRLNPEYYTVWNVRRRCLISGSLSRPSAGSWPSKASPNTSASATTKPPSDDSSPSSSDAIPPALKPQPLTKDGENGTSPDAATASEEQEQRETDGTAATAAAAAERVKQDAAILQSELTFTIPLLIEFPKCYWIWNYRDFILAQAVARLPTAAAREVWTAELALTSKMLSKDRRNFHAWSYRRRVVAELERPRLGGSSLAQPEFDYTTRMIKQDLSNFSAWHNRSKLALRVLDERAADDDDARARFLDDELALAREGLNVGPEDQSLWYYHQFLMSQLTDHVGRPTIAPRMAVEERVGRVERELEEIRDLLEDYDDVKWIYEALLEYSLALEGLRRGASSSAADDDEVYASRQEIKGWLDKLRELDPLRNGRWHDVEKMLA